MSKEGEIKELEQDWAENTRWQGVTRDYTAADVVRLRGCRLSIRLHDVEQKNSGN